MWNKYEMTIGYYKGGDSEANRSPKVSLIFEAVNHAAAQAFARKYADIFYGYNSWGPYYELRVIHSIEDTFK